MRRSAEAGRCRARLRHSLPCTVSFGDRWAIRWWGVVASCVAGVVLTSGTVSALPPSLESSSSLYANRNHALALEGSRIAFRDGRIDEGIRLLQEVLEGAEDSFVFEDGRPQSARDCARRILERSPDAVRRQYDISREALADSRTAKAVALQDLDGLRDVLRSFPNTKAAQTAADRLARIAFDRGDPGTAARLWTGLISARPERGPAAHRLAVKAVAALQKLGDDATASELARTYGFPPVAMNKGGRAESTSARPTPATLQEYQHATDLAPPAFPPRWRRPARKLETQLAEFWTSSRAASGRPIATPASGVVAGGQLYLREPGGLIACNLASGAMTEVMPLATVALSAETEDVGYVETGRNRRGLHDLSRYEDQYAGNGILTSLSTDGEQLYVIERSAGITTPIRTVSQTTIPEPPTRGEWHRSNQVTAIPIPVDATTHSERAWTTGDGDAQSDLAGHYFFGAPVICDDRLLVISEHRQCLYLVALKPATGETLWTQPLGFVSRPVHDDTLRATTRNRPAVANGIAVCSSDAGFVVAVDVVTRQLLWAWEYGDASASKSERHATQDLGSVPGDPSLPSGVLIRRDRVLLMPQDSDEVSCLDLATGHCHWSVPREEAMSLAGLTDSAAILLGRTSVRSLSLGDGRTLWTTRVGAVSGTGILSDTTCLVPLNAGTIVALELSTGRKVGYDSPRDAINFAVLPEEQGGHPAAATWRPGNLMTDGTAIFSIEPFGITALDTTRAALAEQIVSPGSLEAARLELAAGHLDDAQRTLDALRTARESSEIQRQASQLLQEVHYLRLAGGTVEEKRAALNALDPLAETTAARARYLLHATAESDATTRFMRTRCVSELAALRCDSPLPAPDDATHFVTAASWLPRFVGDRSFDNAPVLTADTIQSLDDSELQARLLVTHEDVQAVDLRLELARRAITDGEFHQAEMLLLRAAAHEPASRAHRELDALHRRCGVVTDDDGEGEPTNDAITQVRVSGRLWSPADPGLCETYQQTRRGFLTRGQNPFRIVDLGDTRTARIAVLDLNRGVRLGELSLDARLRFPSPAGQPRQSHYVPIVTSDRIYGLSYLEVQNGQPAWTAPLPDSHFLPQIGPYGTSFCTVQSQSELTVLDPADGKTLWRRTELPAQRTPRSNQGGELFGDDKVLTLLAPDGTTYCVFETSTGCLIDRGRLPTSSLRQRRVLGRKLFFVETRDDRSIARLWDPLPGQPNLEIPFEGGLLEAATRDDHLVLLFGDGRLLVIDAAQTNVVAHLPIGTVNAGQVRSLQAFSDDQRFYVSLFTGDPMRASSPRVLSYVYDTPLSMSHAQGHLLAVNRTSGQLDWSRPTEQRSFLDPAEHAFPCLVALVRQSDRESRSRKTLLVEAVDPQTGSVLGRHTGLLPDQLLQARYDANEDQILIGGMTSTIVLDIVRESIDRTIVSTAPVLQSESSVEDRRAEMP